MKNSKFLLFLASLNIAGALFKILVAFGNGYMIPQGWMNGLLIDMWSVYTLITSDVKHKWVYLVCGAIVYLAITCALAIFAMLDFVNMGW